MYVIRVTAKYLAAHKMLADWQLRERGIDPDALSKACLQCEVDKKHQETVDFIIRKNVVENDSYCPYCLRCPSLVRMQKVGTLHWRCSCGAEHKIEPAKEDSP